MIVPFISSFIWCILNLLVVLLVRKGLDLYPVYLSVAFIRSANAVFIVSLTVTFPGLSAGLQGFLLAVYSIAEALSGVISGALYEILGLRLSLAIASSMLVSLYLFMDLSSSITELAVLNAMAGFSASLILVSSLSAVAEGTMGASRKRIFGVGGFEASNLGGYAIGFSLASLLEILGILRGFTVPATLAMVSLINSLLARDIVARRGFINYRELYSVSRRSMALIPMWFGFAIILGVGFLSPKIIKELNLGIPLPFASSMGKEEDGLIRSYVTNPSIGLFLILALVGVAGGIMLGSLIAAKIGKERSLLLGTFSLPIALIVLGLTYRDLLVFLPLIILIATPALTIPPTLLALLADYTDNMRRGPSAGVYVTILGIGIGLGEILGGRIFDTAGLEPLAYFLALLFLALSLPTSIYVTRSRSRYSWQ